MNTQAIKIIDEMMSKLEEQADMINTYDLGGHNYLSKAKEKISSLPYIDIDSLQRYTVGNEKEGGGYEYHECVRYDDVVNLIK